MDKFTDAQIVDNVNRIRKSCMERNVHPLDDVVLFLRQQSTKPQLKRLYGCTDPALAGGRATHGDAFRF